ncbi:MAG: sugar transferase [Pirellulales bacterium]|nr:sugar transferase [Pirellulales bacterium]
MDRNHSPLAILLLTMPVEAMREDDLLRISEILESRLRITDTAGHFSDTCIGVLLPDTPRSGAIKVAQELLELLKPPIHPTHYDIIIYPDDSYVPVEHQEKEVADGIDIPVSVGSNQMAMFFMRPLPKWKRTVDILGAVGGLLLFAPVIVLTIVAIKMTSRGPILFRHEREGLAGRRFQIIKFRTMYLDAESEQNHLQAWNEQDGPAFKIRKDPRMTLVGRLLRKLSIDEIPQFWNVLRGEMSLVGPRPLPTKESLQCEQWHRRRLDVTPGLTCEWQAKARNAVPFDEWMRMDLEYIQRQSLWHDIKLLLATIPSVIFGKGAC